MFVFYTFFFGYSFGFRVLLFIVYRGGCCRVASCWVLMFFRRGLVLGRLLDVVVYYRYRFRSIGRVRWVGIGVRVRLEFEDVFLFLF